MVNPRKFPKLFLLLVFITVKDVVCILNLTILHTNDVHSRFTQFNKFGGRCPKNQAEDGSCFGGFARQVTKVKEIREKTPNTIFLNAGDFFQGTVWYSIFKWEIVSRLVNQLSIDAMSLGNHEFDDGLPGLLPYLESVHPKIVVCNVDSQKVPDFEKYVKQSVILEVGGEKLGIIGYLTPDTKFLSSTGNLEFMDEVECIKKEAQRLTEKENIDKIIVVGHSGFLIDQEIAKSVPLVDIVVGGHTNTFLYTGSPPSVEEPQGAYPTVIERKDGSICLIVQDFAFGKYLGHLQVQFDDDGKVVSWSGNPILLDSTVEEDPTIKDLLLPYGEEVIRQGEEQIGTTNVLLRGDRFQCRMTECNMGNFLADASLSHFIEDPTEEGWNSVGIALWNSGGIRASIDERINNGSILFEDLLAVAPFSNTMDVVALKGKHLKLVLEKSVQDFDIKAIDPPGSLLQVSGLKVTFNVSMAPGSRVQEVLARCTDCRVPRFVALDDEKVYEVVMNTYMTKGGDGFDMIPNNAVYMKNPEILDLDILKNYLKKCSPVTTGLEGRILIISANENSADSENLTALPIRENSTDLQAVKKDHQLINGGEKPDENVTDITPDITDILNEISASVNDVGKQFTNFAGKISDGLELLNPFKNPQAETEEEENGEKDGVDGIKELRDLLG